MPLRHEEHTVAAQPGCIPEEHASHSISRTTENQLERASRLFRALGDPARLRLAERLMSGPFCVTELAAAEGESISTISQRLRVLRAENIVVRRRQGKHINYALVDRHVTVLIGNAMLHAAESTAEVPEEI